MTRDHRSSIGAAADAAGTKRHSAVGPGPATLPEPDAEAAAQVEAVAAAIRARLAAAGDWIGFAEYMSLALYAPGLGYYSAGAAKFGRAGDFVTAPEISDLFAQVLAGQFAALLRACDTGASGAVGAAATRDGASATGAAGAVASPSVAAAAPPRPERGILEFGPGTGRFAGTVLRELAALDALPPAYLLMEVGADLRARQPVQVRELAGAGAGRARWLDALPGRFEGVVFGNEVLDALPCERFVLRAGAPRRLGVVVGDDGRFAWRERVPDGRQDGDAEFVVTLGRLLPPPLRAQLPEGYTGEFQPAIGPWIATLGALLGRGALLLADYGLPRRHYYHPQRAAGTLRCHYRHRAHDDPFVYPGLTDLSAWVDFTAVAEAADDAGLEVAGFSTQAAVMLAGGIEARLAAAMENGSEVERAKLAHGARQLLLPGEMGESVKLMLLTRGIDAAPAGAFSLQDLRGSL